MTKFMESKIFLEKARFLGRGMDNLESSNHRHVNLYAHILILTCTYKCREVRRYIYTLDDESL